MALNGNLYRAGGIGASNAISEEVWLSTDGGVTWKDQSATSGVRSPLDSISYWAAGGVNSLGQLIMLGGYDWPGNAYSNLIHTSTDQGKNWKTLSQPTPFGGRAGHQVVHTMMNGIDVQVMIGGWGLLSNRQSENFNDGY